MTALVFADHDNAALLPATLNAISAARAIDDVVRIVVAGSDCAAAAEAAARVEEIAGVLVCDDAAYANRQAEPTAALLAEIVGARPDTTAVVATTSTTAKNVMPRLAALMDVAQISDIARVVSPDTFVRPIYAGNAMATVRSRDALKVVTVRTSLFDAAKAEGGSAEIETVAAAADPELTRFIGQEVTRSERPDLTSARIVVSGGRGVGSGESFKLLESLADTLGAAIGASRAAVDAGYVGNDYQVGQTGKVVAPELYIAIGISGAIQHVAGMKDSKVIVAINKDEDAPIFQIADYGMVGDLFELLPELERELAKS